MSGPTFARCATSTRTVAHLTPADVGTDVTLTGPGWAVSGPLRAVHVETEYVDDHGVFDLEPVRSPAGVTVTVTVGPWTATLRNPAAVTVEETP